MKDRNWIRNFAIIVGIVGGIGSLFTGQVLSSLIGVLFITVFFLALASIFEQQREAVEETRALRNSIEAAQRRDGVASAPDGDASVPASQPVYYKGRITCPSCGQAQNDDRAVCWQCGAKLHPSDEDQTATKILF